MIAKNYESDRYFSVWDYHPGHGRLLLRSDKRKGYNENIDIIFYDTTFIQLFAMLKGITIRVVDKGVEYDSVLKYLEYDNKYLFEIESNEEKFYIAASLFSVYENDLDFNQTSLGIENEGRQII